MSLATPTTGEKGVSADAWSLARKVAGKLQGAEEDDIGSLEVGIIDIFDTVVSLYSGLYPRFAALPSPSVDSVLGELAELRVDLEHIRYHAQLTIEGIDGIARSLRKRTSLGAAVGADPNDQIDGIAGSLRKRAVPAAYSPEWKRNPKGVPRESEFYCHITDELAKRGRLSAQELIESIRFRAESLFPGIPKEALTAQDHRDGPLSFDHRIHSALQRLKRRREVTGPENGHWRLTSAEQ